jgi:hypothetical protein
MKKAISFSTFRTNFSMLWDGLKGRFLTSQQSETESSCAKFEKRTLDKMLLLIEENKRLKEELRLRDLHDNCTHDV